MKPSPEFVPIFKRLKAILQKHTGRLKVLHDTPTHFCIGGGLHPTHQKIMPAAWVQVGKAYVSFHQMGVYGFPKLRDGLSKKLLARMQSKSCFNFKTVDDTLFAELEQLTEAGFAAFRKAGYDVIDGEAKIS